MRFASLLSGIALGAALVACGDDGDGTPGTPLYGTWQITKYEYVSVADPSLAVDLVAQGATGTVALNADASYTATITEPGSASVTTTGTWSYTQDTFTLKRSGQSGDSQFDMVVGTNQLTLTGADTEYDFDGDGTPEPAKWNISLRLLQ
jgi:hypothetical protein